MFSLGKQDQQDDGRKVVLLLTSSSTDKATLWYIPAHTFLIKACVVMKSVTSPGVGEICVPPCASCKIHTHRRIPESFLFRARQ